MKLKMFTILTLAGAVALSGCSANKSGSGSSAEPTKAAKTETPTAPVNLNWFATAGFWNPPQWNTEPGTVMGEITKKTGLTFSYNIPAQDGNTKLSLLMVSSSDFPDVITTSEPDISQKLAKSGKIWKLDEFLKKYDPQSHLLKDFPTDIKKQLNRRDGDWYAIPSHMASDDLRKQYPPSSSYFADLAKYQENKAILINSDILKQAGLTLDDLKTEDGLLAALKKVKDMNLTVNGQPVIPIQLNGKNYQGESLQFLERTFGAMPIDKDGKYRDILFAPETKHAFEFLFKTAQGGYFDPGQLTVDSAALESSFLSGRVFCFIGNTANAHFDKLNWVSPGAILSNQGTKPVFAYYSEPGEGWMQTFISKSTKEPERLAKWISFMTSPEGMNLFHYGIEGVDYTTNDKGLIVKTDKGIQDAKDSNKTGVDIFWEFVNSSYLDHMDPAPTQSNGGGALLAQMEAQTAYAKSKEVVRYDGSVLALPGDFIGPGSKNATIKTQEEQYMLSQISKMVLAKDQATFNQLYDEFIAKLKELKVDELDAGKDAELQKKSKEMGVTVKGVNS